MPFPRMIQEVGNAPVPEYSFIYRFSPYPLEYTLQDRKSSLEQKEF